jgi:AcrR family transcriptional regulator
MALVDDRPLRADARRNRAAIVKAARTVFAKYGRAAQMDDVARRAKVGVGTVYRHFPTKEDLLAALAVDRFEQLSAFAREAAEIEDPWEAVRTFIERGAALHASDRALSEMLAESPLRMREAAVRSGLPVLIEALVDRAQAAGAMRADARWEDIPMVFCAASHAVGPPRASWQRMLALTLDGLRAPGSSALPD